MQFRSFAALLALMCSLSAAASTAALAAVVSGDEVIEMATVTLVATAKTW